LKEKKMTKVKNPKAAIMAILESDRLRNLRRQIENGDKSLDTARKVKDMTAEVKELAIEGYGETANLKRFIN
jgi:type II secretory pathway predicted ATPase ExeA